MQTKLQYKLEIKSAKNSTENYRKTLIIKKILQIKLAKNSGKIGKPYIITKFMTLIRYKLRDA